jgi:hypothetical protein
MYSQTCVQRPPLGPPKSGRYSEVVAIQRAIEIFFFNSIFLEVYNVL